jgi:predicted ATPase/pimeloyl-ACP methyl ester carboxylesterase/class 3 adenylate cyclase
VPEDARGGHRLPAQPTALIGRARDLADCRDLLLRPDVRLVTITGPAGTGKTRLALEAAAELDGSFEHGTIFVDLAPIADPALVVSAVAQALGVPDVGGQPLIRGVQAFLRDRCALLVLDNFEQVLAAAPLVVELLAGPGTKALVTSRAALGLLRWEHELPLGPLAVPDLASLPRTEVLATVPAVALFVARARARRPDFALSDQTAAAVAEICVRLDGLPLAIELAAAGAKLLMPQAILSRLQRRLDLPVDGSADFPARHRTLRAAIGWSDDLLASQERSLFRRLAVFVGGFTFEAAQAVCVDDPAEALPLLARLADASLVVAHEAGDEMRYRLLETIREYAAEQLREAGEEEVLRERHAGWFTALAERAEPELRGPDQLTWLDRLEREHDNLRAVAEWCQDDPGRTELGLRLSATTWQFCLLRGHLTEWRTRLAALLAAGPPPSQAVHARALHAAGALAFRLGDYAAAGPWLEESLTLAQRLGDRAGAATVLRTVGRMAIDRGDHATATRVLAESLPLAREMNDRSGVARGIQYQGLLAHFRGDNELALSLLAESLALLRDLGDAWSAAVSCYYLGHTAYDLGRYAVARARWAESLEICGSHRYLWCIPYLLQGFGCLAARDEPVRAMRLAGAARALYETIRAPLPPAWRADYERWLEPARQALPDAARAAAEAAGRAMTLGQAIDYALTGADPARPPVPAPRNRATAPAGAAVPETRYARSGDVNIAYQVIGDGPLDLVLVPGWVSNIDWFWQEPACARFLRRLASFSRLILFDKRGTGLSDRVSETELPTLEQRMDDVRVVMDAAGSERAALCGYSEGGPLCCLFAATSPERTAAVVMIGSYARRAAGADHPWGLTAEAQEAWLAEIAGGWGGPVGLARRAPTMMRDERFVRWWSSFLRASASPAAVLALTEMNYQIDVRHILPAIRVPTLVLHAVGDRSIPVEAGRYLASRIPGAKYVELPGDDHLPFACDADAILDETEEFLTGIRPAAEPDRVLATMLFTEIVGAAEAAARLGDQRWRDLVETHNAVVRQELARYRGREVRSTGQGFLAVFDGPARAIRCAGAVVESLHDIGLDARAGLHTGECVFVGDDVVGIAVHTAARVMEQAGAGEVLVSSTVKDLVAGAAIEFEDRGVQLLSGPGEWHLYRVGRAVNGAVTPATAPVAARPRPDPLTQREQEVATRLAGGLTNRQIAEELVISAATAERHVTNILNKLGYHSRAQIAVWAVEHGLAKGTHPRT